MKLSQNDCSIFYEYFNDKLKDFNDVNSHENSAGHLHQNDVKFLQISDTHGSDIIELLMPFLNNKFNFNSTDSNVDPSNLNDFKSASTTTSTTTFLYESAAEEADAAPKSQHKDNFTLISSFKTKSSSNQPETIMNCKNVKNKTSKRRRRHAKIVNRRKKSLVNHLQPPAPRKDDGQVGAEHHAGEDNEDSPQTTAIINVNKIPKTKLRSQKNHDDDNFTQNRVCQLQRRIRLLQNGGSILVVNDDKDTKLSLSESNKSSTTWATSTLSNNWIKNNNSNKDLKELHETFAPDDDQYSRHNGLFEGKGSEGHESHTKTENGDNVEKRSIDCQMDISIAQQQCYSVNENQSIIDQFDVDETEFLNESFIANYAHENDGNKSNYEPSPIASEVVTSEESYTPSVYTVDDDDEDEDRQIVQLLLSYYCSNCGQSIFPNNRENCVVMLYN
ncbi:hypothetical protein CHUAL_007219 [Chamberlinius hualienensis]